MEAKLFFPLAVDQPVQDDNKYKQIVPVIEQRFYYISTTTTHQELAQHLLDSNIAYDKIEIIQNFDPATMQNHLKFNDLTYQERIYISKSHPKQSEKSSVRVFKCEKCLIKIHICINSNAAVEFRYNP